MNADPGSDRVVLDVPGLDTRMVGAGCCPIPLRTLVIDELRSWPGVRIIEIDDVSGRIVADIYDNAVVEAEHLLEAVRDLGAIDARLSAQHAAG
jgi:hypothetical protein